jgi:hypothetical protein
LKQSTKENTWRYLMFLWCCILRFWPSGMWHHIVRQMINTVSDEHTTAIFSLKVSQVGWLYRRGKGTVLTPCTGSKISDLSILCCPNLQMISRIFKHNTKMVGLCQGRHYFSSTSKDNLGMMTMGMYSIPCKLAEADTRQAGHSMKHILSSKQVRHNKTQH